MKKIRTLSAVLAAILLLTAATYPAQYTGWTVRQTQANQIANLARDMGLEEDDVIIQRAKQLWNADKGREQDIHMLARLMYWEAGNGCAEEHIMLVGRVALNRVADERFPGNLYDVLVAKNQYHPGYANGDGKYAVPADRLPEFENYARRLLDGELADVPGNVLYQDNRRHGTGLYKSFYSELLGTTTYFCYG